MTETESLQAHIRYLEAQLRQQRATLRDAYAQAALTGIMAGLMNHCPTPVATAVEEAIDATFRLADRALVRRDRLPTAPDLNPVSATVSQPTER